ncbi:YesL family protein [Metabacillus malikii]|uniref:Membrane protein YesL n=1 Tax=Metabacillus malikii TaxID=1504265 RepID=A0ABT9ZJP7_9BACI|nr:DUF624 domain-containing protein [Metabacillus malikii]MDQ0232011.1 putative membrane protein YesL [Metabacillus malikii]
MAERLNDLCVRILQLVYLHLLWCVFTMLGLIFFGVGPATYAMYTVQRQWVRGNMEIPIFSTFWQAYRTNIIESSLIGVFYLVVGIILYTDLLYVQSFGLRVLLFIISFLYVISLCFIFPIMVHYEWERTTLKLKCSVLFALSYLQYTLVLLLAVAAIYIVLLMYPGSLMFFGISLASYTIMWLTHQVFMRIEMQAQLKES